MKATDKDQNDSHERLQNQQSMTGSEGGQGFPQSGSEGNSIGSSLGEGNSKKLPSKDEDARKQDERDNKEYGNMGYPDHGKGKSVPHGSSDSSAQNRSDEDTGPTGDLHRNR